VDTATVRGVVDAVTTTVHTRASALSRRCRGADAALVGQRSDPDPKPTTRTPSNDRLRRLGLFASMRPRERRLTVAIEGDNGAEAGLVAPSALDPGTWVTVASQTRVVPVEAVNAFTPDPSPCTASAFARTSPR
jgi:hypothetical protein